MAGETHESPSTIIVLQESVRRFGSRGWRSFTVLALSFICALALLSTMMGGAGDVEGELIRVVHNDDAQIPRPPILDGPSTTALKEVLNNILIDAALQFRPNAKDVRDMDIPHLARQTAVLIDLLRIYDRIPTTTRELQQERAEFKHAIEAMQQALYPWITTPKDGNRTYSSFFDLVESYTEDAGIVISTGREGGFRWAMHQIIVLRKVLNSTLPIEVFYGGDGDLPENYRAFVESLSDEYPDAGRITTVDITKKFPDPENLLSLPGGWAMRPFAILASSFKTAILADADTIFVQDPRLILEEPTYKEFGSIFWHDRTLSAASAETYKWADELLEAAKAKDMDRVRNAGWFKHQTFYEMESGVVVVDKTRNLAGALMTCFLNSHKVRDEITYKRTYGDKESYWIAHALTSTPYHFVPGYSGGIGRISYPRENDQDQTDKERICTLQLLHVLESTSMPMWFNNAITEYKGANDAQYIVPEAWVPHNGRWGGGGSRFPNEFCVMMPENERDKLLGLPDPVIRIEGEFKERLHAMIDAVRELDGVMEQAGLVEIHH